MDISILPGGPAPSAPCAMQQHPFYGRALAALGVSVRTLEVRAGAVQTARAQILTRRLGPVRLRWLPRGPVWAPGTDPGLRRAVLSGILAGGAVPGPLLIQAEDPEGAAELSALRCCPLAPARQVAELDLTGTAASRAARQHGKWRNRLRHARRSGLVPEHRPLDPRRDGKLLAREAIQRRARGYRGLPPQFTLAWAARQPGATRLFTARHRGECVAFILVLLHPPSATYHIGWSGPAGRRLSAHNLLIREAAEWLAGRGIARFDLGLVDMRSAPGLARFKIGCGAAIRPLGPTMLRLPGPPFARRKPAAQARMA